MTEKPIIYIKQTGEQAVPTTVRIEWLPDGSIKPLMFWTPDRSCYRINHVYETTALSFLKEGGVGLRFKVRAELIETLEPYSDCLFSQHDTYLYLSDNWFCGKNIIDDRYRHAAKEYISVTLDVFPDCDYEPIYFIVQGVRYAVERTLAIEPRGSFYAGGVGVWHKVEARLVNADNDDDPEPLPSIRMAALYFEINKWFVTVRK